MKAITQYTYGSADVLELRDIDRPEIAADEVLVRVHAAGVDRGVWHLMTGQPYLARAIGFGLRAPKTPVPGMDLAGVVTAVGPGVTRFAPGDEVLGIGTGAYAEYARAPERKLVAKPANLSFEQAAALAVSGLTALQAVRQQGRVEAGQRVLVIGASGGVGTYAVQVAKAFGAEVTGVCGPTKVNFVRSLGADRVIDYVNDDFADARQHYDVIIDIGGNSPLSRLRRALSPTGTLVLTGGEEGGRWLGGMQRQVGALAVNLFVKQKLRMFISGERLEDLQTLTDLAAAGTITPVIDRTFPLGEAAKAIRYLEDGHARGKIVLTVVAGG